MSKPKHLDARIAAYQALNAVDNGNHADRALLRAIEGLEDPRDRGLATEITYGVLRWRLRLDAELSPHLRGKTNPALWNVLRIGLYQLRYLDRVPKYAAVNTAVSLAKREGFQYAAGMVNAVLRNVDRDGEPPLPQDDSPQSLSLRYSHPEWLVRMWSQQLGVAAAKALMEADQQLAPITIRVRDGDVGHALTFFSELDIAAERSPIAPNAVRITGGGNPQEWGPVREGRWLLQDEAAQLMADLLPPAETHLDLCAAPGGKAFFLADRDGTSEIVAVESEPTRVVELRARLAMLGLQERIALFQGDAKKPVAEGKQFSSVLVDAPCSGLGTLRRNPDRKWKNQPPSDLPKLQLAILRQAARQTLPGGYLLYITCTIWAPENEGVVQAFERDKPDWTRVKKDHPFASEDGFYRSRPDTHGTDGFFAALWRAPGTK